MILYELKIIIHYIKKEDTVIFSLVINPINLYNHLIVHFIYK